MAFDALPLVVNRPYKVLDSSKVTLEAMDVVDYDKQYLFSADLPPACKVLYENVTGKRGNLNQWFALRLGSVTDPSLCPFLRHVISPSHCHLMHTWVLLSFTQHFCSGRLTSM